MCIFIRIKKRVNNNPSLSLYLKDINRLYYINLLKALICMLVQTSVLIFYVYDTSKGSIYSICEKNGGTIVRYVSFILMWFMIIKSFDAIIKQHDKGFYLFIRRKQYPLWINYTYLLLGHLII